MESTKMPLHFQVIYKYGIHSKLKYGVVLLLRRLSTSGSFTDSVPKKIFLGLQLQWRESDPDWAEPRRGTVRRPPSSTAPSGGGRRSGCWPLHLPPVSITRLLLSPNPTLRSFFSVAGLRFIRLLHRKRTELPRRLKSLLDGSSVTLL